MSLPRSKISLLVTGLLLLGSGCKESLPPYAPPENFTEGILSCSTDIGGSADTVSTIFIKHHCADYNATQIKVALKNIYEETLEGSFYMRAHVEIDGLDEKVPFHRELNSENTDLQNLKLTLDPGESYTAVLLWDRRDDDGHLIDTGIDTTYFAKPDTSRRQSPPIAFRLRASIQVWKEVPPRATNEFILRLIFYTGDKCIEGFVQ